MNTTLLDPIEKNAISARDKKTWICSNCGKDESLVDFMVATGKVSLVPFESVSKEKYFCKKLGVVCNVK